MAVYSSRESVAVLDASARQTPTTSFSLQRFLWRWGSERLLWTVLAIAVFVVAIVPLIYTIDAAFYRETRTGLASDRSLNAFLNVYFSAEYLGYLASAVFLATLVTFWSLIVGVAMALLMARTDLPAKNTLELLIIMPLYLSPFTVKKHLENIYGKLGVRNRTEAIGKAQALGWLERAGA